MGEVRTPHSKRGQLATEHNGPKALGQQADLSGALWLDSYHRNLLQSCLTGFFTSCYLLHQTIVQPLIFLLS